MSFRQTVSWGFFSLFMAVIVVTACEGNSYALSREMPGDCWAFSDSLELEKQLQEGPLQLGVLLNFTDAYNYQNLYLRLHLKGPANLDTTIRATETFIDPLGNWLAEKKGSQYVYSFQSFQAIGLEKSGKYRLSLYQDMREDMLCGIAEVQLFWIEE